MLILSRAEEIEHALEIKCFPPKFNNVTYSRQLYRHHLKVHKKM